MIKLVDILNEIRPRGGGTFVIKPEHPNAGEIISPLLDTKMEYQCTLTRCIINVSSDWNTMDAIEKKLGIVYNDDEGYPVDESAYFCDNNLHFFENFFGEAKTELDGYGCTDIVIPIDLFKAKISESIVRSLGNNTFEHENKIIKLHKLNDAQIKDHQIAYLKAHYAKYPHMDTEKERSPEETMKHLSLYNLTEENDVYFYTRSDGTYVMHYNLSMYGLKHWISLPKNSNPENYKLNLIRFIKYS